MKIALLGSRGIPNIHGGFEQFAEYLSVGLVEYGHEVSVYTSNNHPIKQSTYKGVNIIHIKDPEDRLGTFGQFLYDYNCIRHVRKQNFDIIYQLGYTSSSIWGWLLPMDKCIVTTNMDGLEWKRSKYSKPVRLFLRFAERLAVKYSHYHVADSIGIQQYLKLKYNIESTYLPYGSFVFENYDQKIIEDYKLKPFAYNILVARMEPENHIEEIIEAHILSETDKPLVLVGNYLKTKFGRYLFEKYKNRTNILFLGGIYDQFRLNNLRYFSNLYFHGHSVGGTNPSLLEAMGSNCLICAHNNPFNQTILGSEAFYFKGSNDLADIIKNKQKLMHPELIMLNTEKIKVLYSWEKIVSDYEKYFHFILKNKG